jgi:signal transduction histidine kinase
MRRMIDQLLVFTQSLHDVVPAKRQTVDLAGLVRSIAHDAAHTTPREIAIQTEASATVSGDPGRLSRVVDNLLTNAIRHGEGTVTLRVTHEGDAAVLAVHNLGRPIPAQALPTLFDPYTRAGSRAGGLGLGLYIVDQIVRNHGGSIAVASNAEAGTTFTVRLPTAPA